MNSDDSKLLIRLDETSKHTLEIVGEIKEHLAKRDELCHSQVKEFYNRIDVVEKQAVTNTIFRKITIAVVTMLVGAGVITFKLCF